MRFAQELDESERQIMAEKGTETKEFLEYMRVRTTYDVVLICRMIVKISVMMAISAFKSSLEHLIPKDLKSLHFLEPF